MNVASQHHQLLDAIKKLARPIGDFPIQKYLGTTHKVYNVAVPDLRKIASSWSREHRDMPCNELTTLVDQLFRGTSREEKVIASMLLGRFPKHLMVVNEQTIGIWLSQLSGWEEVDSFCDELATWLLADQKKRLSYLSKWAKNKQIEKRRASLVILCSAVRLSDDKKLADLSFDLINQLKYEKGVMITKAVSWLLRSLLKYHRVEVIAFLKKEMASLPAIAVRETTKKLETGTQ